MEKLKEIPNKLNICGFTYEIILEDRKNNRGVNANATCNSNQQKIWIDTNQCEEAQISCLIHEILEALDYHYELELPHKTISILEAGLFQVIKDNFLKQERSKS